MSLDLIYPLTYQEFNERAGSTVQAVIDHFTNDNPNFWMETLRRHSFRATDYRRGIQTRIEFNEKIRSCTDANLLVTANEILEWGGMKSITDEIKQELRQSLDCLNGIVRNEMIDLNNLCVKRLASITKIYEMWDLHNWVIYDSFCARGLQWLISNLWQSIGRRTNEQLLKLPWPPGRSGSPIPGFPRTGKKHHNKRDWGSFTDLGFAKLLPSALLPSRPTDIAGALSTSK